MNNKLTIFLSHSHKDEEKVRRIRDVLETLDCEPLMFFLKCLDDNNDELEDFIKREICARNIFCTAKAKIQKNLRGYRKRSSISMILIQNGYMN